MPDEVSESITVQAEPGQVYRAVSDLHRMVRWSPECFAVWIWRRRSGTPARFVGFNRRGPFVWFTTCRVVAAEPAREFGFDVTTFGMPVSRWGYRMTPSDGGTEVTEYWLDRLSRGAFVLGGVFTRPGANTRPAATPGDGGRQPT